MRRIDFDAFNSNISLSLNKYLCGIIMWMIKWGRGHLIRNKKDKFEEIPGKFMI